MLKWLEQYLGALVSKPEELNISEKRGVTTVVVSIKMAPEDRGLLAGRNNRLMRALNVVASLAGLQPRMRYVLKLSD